MSIEQLSNLALFLTSIYQQLWGNNNENKTASSSKKGKKEPILQVNTSQYSIGYSSQKCKIS